MRKKSQTILIITTRLACFGAGISVPAILNKKTTGNSKEQEKFDTIYSILNSDWYYSNKIKNLVPNLWNKLLME